MQAEYTDIFAKIQEIDPLERKMGSHGYVKLLEISPRIIPNSYEGMIDLKILRVARTSTGGSNKSMREDLNLLRYLFNEKHSSPFEFITFEFELMLPIYVDRQLARHRMAHVNEMSARYTTLPDFFDKPSIIRKQSAKNHQGSDGIITDQETLDLFQSYMEGCELQYKMYEELLARGVAREQARIGLPLNIYTKKIWRIDLRNLLHFLELRMDAHAQMEIQQYANAIYDLIKLFVPNVMELFDAAGGKSEDRWKKNPGTSQ